MISGKVFYGGANAVVNKENTIVKEGDTIFYDKHAGHDIGYNNELYRVIRMRDIVLVE